MSNPLREALERIAEIIAAVDQRAMAVDGDVPSTRLAMTDGEMRQIYYGAVTAIGLPVAEEEPSACSFCGKAYERCGPCWDEQEQIDTALFPSEPVEPSTTKDHMRLIVDVDWATMRCPCGQEICSRFESDDAWVRFKKEHAEHTSGYISESATAKALAWGNTDPNLRPLFPETQAKEQTNDE